MFQMTISPELLAFILAGFTAVLFDWVPGLSEWFTALSESRKKQLMIALMAAITLSIYGGVCGGVFVTQISCNSAGFSVLMQIFLLSIGINQGVHLLTKPTQDYKLINQRLGDVSKGQGVLEYVLILVLGAVLVIAALTFMSPLIAAL